MADAQYAVLLSRAVPALSLDQILGGEEAEVPGTVSLARGWGLILASCLLHGEAMVWPGEAAQRGARYVEAVWGR